MKNILVVCTSGLGTSLAIRLFVEKFFKENGIGVDIEHADIGSAFYIKADLIIGAKQVIDCLPSQERIEAIGLKDIVNRQYITERLLNSTTIQNWLREKEGTS